MENIIYNELLFRGYSVDVGLVEIVSKDKTGKSVRKQLEVDFVVNNSDQRYYIQSAYSIPDEEKLRQETTSFRSINDSFKRIVIVKDDIAPYRDEHGDLFVSLSDFLLDKEIIIAG